MIWPFFLLFLVDFFFVSQFVRHQRLVLLGIITVINNICLCASINAEVKVVYPIFENKNIGGIFISSL